jgi:hypothetical protein
MNAKNASQTTGFKGNLNQEERNSTYMLQLIVGENISYEYECKSQCSYSMKPCISRIFLKHGDLDREDSENRSKPRTTYKKSLIN